jgi:hypothetical protein
MADDEVIGDGGNVTVYQRPDRSRYALDKRGVGKELAPDAQVFGRARFDARELSTGRWKGSRCTPEVREDPNDSSLHRARLRGSRFRTGG